MAQAIQTTKHGLILTLAPEVAGQVNNAIKFAVEEMQARGYTPVLLVAPNIRLVLKRFTRQIEPTLAVLSYNEILPDIEIESIKTVRLKDDH
jgi:flagellar biosynthesis protein FlhA